MSEMKIKAPTPIEADAYKSAEGELMTDSGTGNSYKVTADGVYQLHQGKEPLKLCDPIEIVARTRDKDGLNWGVWIRFKDDDEKVHELILRRKLFSQGRKVEELLQSAGLRIFYLSGNSGKCPLAEFFNLVPKTLPSALSVNGGGFPTDKFDSFVFGNEVVKLPNAEPLILEDKEAAATLNEKGTLEDWQRKVSVPALHSTRLMFGLCAAFAAPLLPIVGVPSTLFHFYGKKGKGKTSILKAAASVNGGEERLLTWKATDNGLEGLAQVHNNQPLILDEIGQATDKALDSVYDLTNGVEKTRKTRDAKLRKPTRWKINILSSGEHSLTGIKKQKSRRGDAGISSGELVRFICIPADSGHGLGVLDSLPDTSEGEEDALSTLKRAKAFVDAFAALEATGSAGRAFLMALMSKVNADSDGVSRMKSRLKAMINTMAETLNNDAPLTDSELRVLERFAVVALAGELATSYGIMGDKWATGTATKAVLECFKAWRTTEDSPGMRIKRIVEKLQELPDVDRSNFLQYVIENGTHRRWHEPLRPAIGAVLMTDGNNMASRIATFFLAQQFADLCNNYGENLSKEEIVDALKEAEVLVTNVKGRNQYQLRKDFCEWKKNQRLYVLLADSSEQCRQGFERMIKGF